MLKPSRNGGSTKSMLLGALFQAVCHVREIARKRPEPMFRAKPAERILDRVAATRAKRILLGGYDLVTARGRARSRRLRLLCGRIFRSRWSRLALDGTSQKTALRCLFRNWLGYCRLGCLLRLSWRRGRSRGQHCGRQFFRCDLLSAHGFNET
jgi:hypothetical protein